MGRVQHGLAVALDDRDLADVEANGVERRLGELARAIKEEKYRPDPLRRAYIPKPSGKPRPLGISTLRDRLRMTAAMPVPDPATDRELA